MAWMARLPKLDSKGYRISWTSRMFPVKKFMGPGMTEAQAEAAALEAAKGFHAELGEKGILSLPKPRDPDVTSEEPGVAWKKRRKRWEVMIRKYRRGSTKYIYGATFAEKAVGQSLGASGKPWAAAPGEARGRLVVAPSVPYPGVKLNQLRVRGEAHGPLGGGAGALLQKGRGMEFFLFSFSFFLHDME